MADPVLVCESNGFERRHATTFRCRLSGRNHFSFDLEYLHDHSIEKEFTSAASDELRAAGYRTDEHGTTVGEVEDVFYMHLE